MESVEGSNSITVYCTQGLPTLKAVQVGEQIKNLDNISECELVPKDQAVEEMLEMLGDNGTVLEGLMGDDNFLPDSYRISMTDLSLYDETVAQITSIEGVEKIIDYSDIANQLTQLDDMVTTVCFWITLLLGVVSLFIIANTIRVALFSRRVEISIMKSVGATNWFVRVPFIVEGLLIGLVSGGLASIILNLAYDSVMSSLAVLSFFTPLPLGPYRMRIVLIFLLEKVPSGQQTDEAELQHYARIQRMMRILRDALLENDAFCGELRSGDDLLTEWEYDICGGWNGLSIGLDIEDFD